MDITKGAPAAPGGLAAADPKAALSLGARRLQELTAYKQRMQQQAAQRQAAMEQLAQLYESDPGIGRGAGLAALGRNLGPGMSGFTKGMSELIANRDKLAEREYLRKAAGQQTRVEAEEAGMTDIQNEAKISEQLLGAGGAGKTFAPHQYTAINPDDELPHRYERSYNSESGEWGTKDLGVVPAGEIKSGTHLKAGFQWVEEKDHSKGQMKIPEMEPIDSSDLSKGYKVKDTKAVSLSPDAIDGAARVFNKTGKFPPNMGRGAQGNIDMVAVQNHAAELRRTEGLAPEEMLTQWGILKGQQGAYNEVAKRVGKIDVAVNEAHDSMKITEEKSAAVPRTNFPAVNGGIQFFESHFGDKDLRAFQASLNTLVNVYSRAVNPTGAATVHDKEHARELLSVVDGPEAFAAVMATLKQEIEVAKRSAHRTLKELEPGRGGAAKPRKKIEHPAEIQEMLNEFRKP
jgi:hypothetical protein